MNVFELFGTIAIDSSGAERSIDKTVGHAKNAGNALERTSKRIGTDVASGAKRSLDKTVGHARDAESKLEKTFKRIGTVVAAAFTIDKIVDFGKACTQAYASIAAEESAFAQIMGDYAGTAQLKLQAVSEATGVTSTRLTGAMTSLTAKFKGLGYGVEDATTLASDGLLIASDAAAFWDMSLDEAMSHLNSFINGSYEGGEAIGLFANDTQMAAYAVEKGIVADAKAWASLDEATKQATRLDYAKNMQQQSGATGQAAKEASSYANVMANLKEHWRQFQGVVGKPILEKFVLPAMQKLEKFMPKLTESVTAGIEWLGEGFDKIASYFSEVFTEDGLNMDALPDALRNMLRDVARTIPRLLSNVGRSIRNAWANVVWPAVQGAFKAVLGLDLPTWGELESIVTNWWDGGNGIKAAIANACNWTLNLFGAPATVTEDDVSNVLDSWWTGAKTLVTNFCSWALSIFNPPTEDGTSVVSGWWKGVKKSIEDTIGIDLPDVDIAGIFAAGETAINSLISAAKNLYTRIKGSISLDEKGKVDLDKTLSNLFAAGSTAIADILKAATTLVADVVGKITGNEEQAEQIGGVFSDLFGVANEVITGVVDAGLEIFKWFKENGYATGLAIGAISVALASFVLANPAIAVIEALGAVIALMLVDWEHFEENYPHLVTLFEDLTGLDFTDTANSLAALQNGLEGLVTFFAEHQELLNTLFLLLGGLAMYSGHYKAGVVLLAAGAGGTIADIMDETTNPETVYEDQPNIVEAKKTGDYSNLTEEEKSRMEFRDSGAVTTTRGAASWLDQTATTMAAVNGLLLPYQVVRKEFEILGQIAEDLYVSSSVNGQEIAAKPMFTYEELAALKDELEQKAIEATQTTDSGKEEEPATTPPPTAAPTPSTTPAPNDGLSPAATPTVEFVAPATPGSIKDLLPSDTTGTIGTLLQALSTMKTDVTAAVNEGFATGVSGITIKGYITTGDVRLDNNVLAGEIAPKVDLILGWNSTIAGRGNA